MKWSPIEDLPSDAERWIGQDYLSERGRWHETRTALRDPVLDKTVLNLWTEDGTGMILDTLAASRACFRRRGEKLAADLLPDDDASAVTPAQWHDLPPRRD